MSKKSKSAPKRRTVIIACDRSTSSYLGRVMAKSGLAHKEAGGCGVALESLTAARSRYSALVLEASQRHGKEQLKLARALREANVPVFIWSSDRPVKDLDHRDDWILDRLLEQEGALVSAHLPVLIEALRIYHLLPKHWPGAVRIKGRASGLTNRLDAALDHRDIDKAVGRTPKSVFSVEAKPLGELTLKSDRGIDLPLSDPQTAAFAIALLLRLNGMKHTIDDPEIEVSEDEVKLIVRPPSRMLSELTSKRLAACFGISSCRERLCHSASEAVRFASQIDGPVVLKVAKPELEHKQMADAIKTNIQGQSAVRSAFYALESLGESISPIKPLGVLVARQIQGGSRMWLLMSDHPEFGRLVLVGQGDTISDRPIIALKTPCDAGQALRALADAGLAPDDDKVRKIALAVGRFSRMAHMLGSSISRAEIHPLVATKEDEAAMALDMLVAITGALGK